MTVARLQTMHFLAIPFNTNAPDAARVVADFMLSPEAQIRKADARIWGDPTVLSMARLTAADKAAFDALPRGVATLSEADLGKTLAEPHPSWMGAIEAVESPLCSRQLAGDLYPYDLRG